MFFKKKTEKARNIRKNEAHVIMCNDVYVLTTEIVSNYNDGNSFGPQIVTLYYLGIKAEDEYYDLFSGVKLEKEECTKSKCYIVKTFNKPYITKVEPLKEYLNDKKKETIELELLFDFITDMNVTEIVSQRNLEIYDDEE